MTHAPEVRAPDLQGFVATGFEPVADAFLRNFTEHADVGAACCVHVGGDVVVDVWAGDADRDGGRAWARDTIVIVFSSTKGVAAVAANQLIERGDLDPDAPVARYWPEFAAKGKERIPVEWVLSHRAGLAALDVPDLTLDDIVAWDPVIDAIVAQSPNWEPGTAHGYHVRTYGWIVGELIRRITGKMPGEYVAAEITGPLGLDFMIGVPEHEDARVAPVYPALHDDPELERLAAAVLSDESTLLGRAMSGPSKLFAYDDRWNGRPLRAAQMPSSNGHGDARSLSRMYAACIGEIDGVRLLAPETVERATIPRSTGTDCVVGQPLHFGLGFSLPPTLGLDPGPRSFGHAGAGGSLAFADPDRELAFSYVMNQMRFSVTEPDPRAQGLVAATCAVIDQA
jgi:CubicO group peptidase (beta-lactamase class C family)